MVRTSKGLRFRTRKLLSKKPRQRGMSPITYALQTFESGDKVHIIIDPSVHKGQPHKRFYGLTATVVDSRGEAYILELKQGRKTKQVIARPEHLRKAAV